MVVLTSLHRESLPCGRREGGRWAFGEMQELINMMESGEWLPEELWPGPLDLPSTLFLDHGCLIPRSGAVALLDLEGEAVSPKGPDLKLCLAWLSPSGT